MRAAKLLVAFEAILFGIASLIHGGVLIHGFEHGRASTAEGIIALVLVIGLVAALVRPGWARTALPLAQGFALLGTLVGAFTIIIGIGPQTTPDHVFHVFLLVILIAGLIGMIRARRG